MLLLLLLFLFLVCMGYNRKKSDKARSAKRRDKYGFSKKGSGSSKDMGQFTGYKGGSANVRKV